MEYKYSIYQKQLPKGKKYIPCFFPQKMVEYVRGDDIFDKRQQYTETELRDILKSEIDTYLEFAKPCY